MEALSIIKAGGCGDVDRMEPIGSLSRDAHFSILRPSPVPGIL